MRSSRAQFSGESAQCLGGSLKQPFIMFRSPTTLPVAELTLTSYGAPQSACLALKTQARTPSPPPNSPDRSNS